MWTNLPNPIIRQFLAEINNAIPSIHLLKNKNLIPKIPKVIISISFLTFVIIFGWNFVLENS